MFGVTPGLRRRSSARPSREVRGPRPPTGGSPSSPHRGGRGGCALVAGAGGPDGCRVLARTCSSVRASALALLVAQVLADHHDATVPADDLALVADLLDAGLDLHASALLFKPGKGHYL